MTSREMARRNEIQLRRRVVIRMVQQGNSVAFVARLLGVHQKTVRSYLRKRDQDASRRKEAAQC